MMGDVGRDPRTDPRPGDELRTGDRPETGNFTIVHRGRTRVTWRTPNGCEYGEDISWFRETFKRATVVKKGEPE